MRSLSDRSEDRMRIRLRLFAILRERSGISETEIEIAEGMTVAMAVEEVGRRFVTIADLLPRAAAAVNLAWGRVGADSAGERWLER
jgi:molybdopterin converting factor small subunit